MFKMETDDHNFRKNVTTDKKYILIKMGLKFKTLSSAFYIFFVIKCELFGVKKSMRSFWNKQEWLYKTVYFNFLRN